MSTMSLRLPNWLHKQLREFAKLEGTSINQLISARARLGTRKKFEAALRTAPDVEPEAFDRLPGNALSRPRRQVSRGSKR